MAYIILAMELQMMAADALTTVLQTPKTSWKLEKEYFNNKTTATGYKVTKRTTKYDLTPLGLCDAHKPKDQKINKLYTSRKRNLWTQYQRRK